MSLRNGVLCLFLFFFVFLLSLKNYETWTRPVELSPEKGTIKKSERKTESPPMMGNQKEPTAIESYILVAEKNIFNFERKEFPILLPPPRPPPPAEVKKPMVRPQIILYGVVIADNYQFASIAQLGRALQRGERETMTLKVGDQIGEYKLAKILPDRIAFEAQEDTFEVFLYDSKMPKRRMYVKTENRPATAISALPAPAPPPAGTPQPIPPGVERPAEPIVGKTTEMQIPRPVTPAPIPFPRIRRERVPIGSSVPIGPPAPTEPIGPPAQ